MKGGVYSTIDSPEGDPPMGGPGHPLGADRWGDSTELGNRGVCGSGYRQLQAKVDAGLRKETDLASSYRQTKRGEKRSFAWLLPSLQAEVVTSVQGADWS